MIMWIARRRANASNGWGVCVQGHVTTRGYRIVYLSYIEMAAFDSRAYMRAYVKELLRGTHNIYLY
jgi:hypothetical protein